MIRKYPTVSRNLHRRTRSLIGLGLALVLAAGMSLHSLTANAASTLTVTPLTWNVIGLDSNNVNVGPNDFPIGVRVCNTGGAPATNLSAQLVWDSTNSFVYTRPGTSDTLSLTSLSNTAPNNCAEFYFEVEVKRDSNAYDTKRQYHISVTADNGISASTPPNREMYVEHLVSQNRNAVTNVIVSGATIPPGGTMTLVAGNTYDITLIGYTATQGYNQLESFINFPNTIFQILSVASTYTAGPTNTTMLYADSCGWDNDITSATYRSCIVSDNKAGGDVTVTYKVKILSAGSTNPGGLNTLLYDFSGSSYHYNSDYGTSIRYAYIVDPTAIHMAKSFSPDTTPPGGTSMLTITLTNTATVPISDVNFTDPLPFLSPGQMVVAAPLVASTSGCGTPTFAPATGASTLIFSNGTIVANGSCTITVGVKIPASPTTGAYHNVSNNAFVGTLDSGHNATADLTIGTASSGTGVCGLTLAQWNFNSLTTDPPPQPGPSTQASDVATAQLSIGNSLTDKADTTAGGGNPQPGVLTFGWPKVGPIDTATYPYMEFAVDTSKYSNVNLSFDATRKANGPNNDAVYYSTNGTTWTLKSTFTSTTSWVSFGLYNFLNLTNTGGVTYFRIYGYGANATSQGNDMNLDNVTITGCGTPQPPKLIKKFGTDPVVVNGTSLLTFTLSNPNATALNGLAFTDVLPAGVTVATSGPTAICSGALTATAPSTISFSGGKLNAGAACDIPVTVTVTTAGPHANVSGFVTSTESGPNTSSEGVATDSVTAVLPPLIDKYFEPTPILPGGVSTLTFVITNPNPGDALPNVAFTDTFPALAGGAPGNMLVADPPAAATSGCGTPTFAPVKNTGSISFSGGTIAGGGTCIVSVNVTAPTIGDYPNTSGAVTTKINNVTSGSDTASSTLTVKAPNPGIILVKQVSTSNLGPWSYFVSTPTGKNVYYRFVIENTGDVPLVLTSSPVTDLVPAVNTLLGGCTWTSPLPVASKTVDPTETCIVGPVSAAVGTHPNTATARGTYNSTPYTDVDSASYIGVDPPLVAKSFAPDPIDAGAASTMTITIQNPAANTVAFTGVTFTDTLPSGLEVANPSNATNTCGGTLTADAGTTSVALTNGTVAVNSTCTITVDILATSIGGHLNTITVTTSNSDPSLPASDTLTSQAVAGPSFTLTKLADAASIDQAGDILTYTIIVTNTGNVALTVINVTDPMISNLDCDGTAGPPYVISGLNVPVGGAINCTGSYVVQQSDIDSNGGGDGTIDNSATVTTAEAGSNTDSTSVDVQQTPSFTIQKDADVGSVDAVNDIINYTITLTNTGNMSLSGVSVADPLLANLDCDGTAGLPYTSSGLTVPVGAALTCSGVYSVSQTDIDTNGGGDGTIDNTVSGDTDQTGSQQDTNSVLVLQTPAFTITKDANVSSVDSALDVITYTITLNNTGNMTLTGVAVSDPMLADLDCDGLYGAPYTSSGFTVVVGGSLICSGTYTVSQADIDNNGGGDGAIDNTASGTADQTDPASDTQSVPLTRLADFTVQKAASLEFVDSTTDVITYTIVVTNTGNATLTEVQVSDPLITNLDCDGTIGAPFVSSALTIPVGGGLICSGTYAVTQMDIDTNGGGDGLIENTVTVTSADAGPLSDSTDVIVNQNPDFTLDKKADVTSVGAVNSVITYTITLSNTGNTTLSGVALSDPMLANLDCDGTSGAPYVTSGLTVAVGADLTCSGTYTVTQADIDTNGGGDGSIDNTVGADTDQTDAQNANESVLISQTASFKITKDADVSSVDALNDVIKYSIVVANTGNTTLTSVSVTDPMLADLDCDGTAGAPYVTSGLTIAVGGSLHCNGSYTVTQNDLDTNGGGDGLIDNTATATSAQMDPLDASAQVLVQYSPSYTIQKTADVSSANAANDVISYTITVTNTGNVTLTDTAVSDPMLSDLDCDGVAGPPHVTTGMALPVGASFTCSGTYTVHQSDIDDNGGGDGTIDNTAAITSAEADPLDDSAQVTVEQNPSFTIQKDADATVVGAANDVITYTVTLANSGNTTLTGVTVSDPMLSNLDCDGVNGAPYVTSGLTIAVNASLTCHGTYTVLQSDIDNNGGGDGKIDNTVTASTDQTDPNSDTQSVPVTRLATFTVTKKADVTSVDAVNDPINYTVLVTNTGNTTLTSVSVDDPMLTNLDCDGVAGAPFVTSGLTIAVENSLTCTGTYSVAQTDLDTNSGGDGTIDNTVTVSPNEAGPQDASESVDIVQGPAMNITKTVTSSGPYQVDDPIVYSIVVENTGNLTLTGVTVSDPYADLGTCSQALPATLAPGASLTCPASHTVTSDDLRSGGYTNSATADSDQTPSDNDSKFVDFIVSDLSLEKRVDDLTPHFGANVTFTITVLNSGPDAATNVRVTDVLPDGLVFVSSNASQGSYSSTTGVWTIGSLAVEQSVTLSITVTVLPSGNYTNTAEVSAADQADPDSLPGNEVPGEDDQASASVTPAPNAPNTLSKMVAGTDQGFTTASSVAIGEVVTYRVSVIVPPGSYPASTLEDTLGQGLAFVDCASIDASGLTTDRSGGFAAACSNASAAVYPPGSTNTVDIGRRVTFDLGTLANNDTKDHTLTITYHVIVLDSSANVDKASLSNSVVFYWDEGQLDPATAQVQIVEPKLGLLKTANNGFVTLGSQVNFTLTVQHLPTSSADAFDVTITDILPAELQFVPGSLDCSAGAQDADVACSFDGVDTVTATWGAFTRTGGSGIVRFSATILSFPATGSIVNVGVATWTSLPGDQSEPRTSNPYSHERFYDPNDPVDIYGSSSTVSLRAIGGQGRNQGPAIPSTGFAQGRVTVLKTNPVAYDSTGGLVLEIPLLKAKISIVGVPIKDFNWNIDWLTNQAGWLEGSAFPSLPGNSVLTGHATSRFGVPGPFANLNRLGVGDTLFLHSNGMIYIYEVRSARTVLPNDLGIFQHEDKAWLTLVTCSEYNAKTGAYLKRFVIKAILVETRAE